MKTPAEINPFNLDYLKSCNGYDENFISSDTPISLHILADSHKKYLPVVDGNNNGLLKYTNLSVWYNQSRKIPFVSAYNIDGGSKRTISRDGVKFQQDPRFSDSQQLGYPFYDLIKGMNQKTEFEIGHMASHNEMSWGDNAKTKCFQTFHFPNSVPQGEKLNSGLWSRLESYVIQEGASANNTRICVFTGPMMNDSDLPYVKDKSFKIPTYFFKLVVYEYEGKLYSTAFVMSHYKKLIELGVIKETISEKARIADIPHPFSDYNHKDVYQIDIDSIEDYTGYNFKWKEVERITIPNGSNKLESIKSESTKRNLELIGLDEKYNGKIPKMNMILRK